jgi:hypothetical protein
MIVLGDEARRDDLVREGLVNDIRLAGGRRFQLVDRADGQDAVAENRDGGGGGLIGIEGDDLLRAKDRDPRQLPACEPVGQILKRFLTGERRSGRVAEERAGRRRGRGFQHLAARRECVVSERLGKGRVAHDAHGSAPGFPRGPK